MSAALSLSSAVVTADRQAQLPPPAPAVDPAIADAQQPPSPDQLEQVKQQARSFAAVLRSAVEIGGQRLQKRVLEIVPTAPSLGMAGEPDIVGAPHPDGGFVFHVQVPDILPSYGPLVTWWQRQQEQGVNPRPVSTARPAAVADKAPGNLAPEAAVFDPDREYSEFVRDGLIEAMIENSHALGIGEDGHLVVVASVTAAVRRNPLDTSRLLILSLRGEDLVAYRQNRLTKEEVRARVRDRRF
jgi:hypothetical protein